ncbi:MAG: hypothetical protein Q8O89_03805 [Nanoarchaeota archaeon]|nr:hypothetical protein [Nanoarchaeota archaeon]
MAGDKPDGGNQDGTTKPAGSFDVNFAGKEEPQIGAGDAGNSADIASALARIPIETHNNPVHPDAEAALLASEQKPAYNDVESIHNLISAIGEFYRHSEILKEKHSLTMNLSQNKAFASLPTRIDFPNIPYLRLGDINASLEVEEVFQQKLENIVSGVSKQKTTSKISLANETAAGIQGIVQSSQGSYSQKAENTKEALAAVIEQNKEYLETAGQVLYAMKDVIERSTRMFDDPNKCDIDAIKLGLEKLAESEKTNIVKTDAYVDTNHLYKCAEQMFGVMSQVRQNIISIIKEDTYKANVDAGKEKTENADMIKKIEGELDLSCKISVFERLYQLFENTLGSSKVSGKVYEGKLNPDATAVIYLSTGPKFEIAKVD